MLSNSVLAAVLLAVTPLCVASAEPFEPSAWARSESGWVEPCVYDGAHDCYDTTIVTDDGEAWCLEDFWAPEGSECWVDFNTHGTSSVSDDTIVSITIRTEFA